MIWRKISFSTHVKFVLMSKWRRSFHSVKNSCDTNYQLLCRKNKGFFLQEMFLPRLAQIKFLEQTALHVFQTFHKSKVSEASSHFVIFVFFWATRSSSQFFSVYLLCFDVSRVVTALVWRSDHSNLAFFDNKWWLEFCFVWSLFSTS